MIYNIFIFSLYTIELDTNRSLFHERNLWIPVTVRSFTSTKTFLTINLSASPGIIHTKNEQLHWFEGKKVSVFYLIHIHVSDVSFFFKLSKSIRYYFLVFDFK